MLRREDEQLNFADMDNWQERIPKNSFYYCLRQWVENNLSDEQFSHLYSEGKGRPSLSPTRMLTATIIQLEKGYSDREMDEAAQFDDRVKYALRLSRSPQYRVTHSSLSRYRKMFLEDNIGRKILKMTLQTATAAGLFEGADKDLVDSFMIHGATSKQDTFTLIRKAMARVLRLSEKDGLRNAIELILEHKEYGKNGKPKINWNIEEEKQKLLTTLVNDARWVKELISQYTVSDELKDAVDLLQLVAEQDIEENDGQIKIRRGVAKDRTISIKDPEMRHGRKTTSYKTDGYKGHIMTGGKDCELVISTTATPANAPDESALDELEEQRKENLGRYSKDLLADTAYGGADTRKNMQEQGINLIAKVPPASNKKGLFSKEEFNIDLKAGLVTCPANQTVSTIPKRKSKKQIQRAEKGIIKFPKEKCNSCPLKDKCTNSKSGRTIRIHENEELLQAARAKQETVEFKEEYSTRANVERTIAHLTRHGARKTRLVGTAWAKFKLALHGAVRNIMTIPRLLKKQAKEELQAATG
ncbi:IS1182 family transposase [Desulfolucanica intricata]|uniref:IS1182 family transposase n=1 Tax=Desulfolucanica intricata TaxID=1285191 RepID=UPI0008317F09|nr:IS1182 family transposase [Desulfolucanica intricata]